MTERTEVHDEFGNVVRVGDHFVKPQRFSSSAWLAIYEAVAFENPKNSYGNNIVKIKARKKGSTGWRGRVNDEKLVSVEARNFMKVDWNG